MKTEKPNTDTTEEEDMRTFAKNLFADDEDLTPAAVPDTNEGNRVPKEGSDVRQSPPNGDLREFVRDLFDRTD